MNARIETKDEILTFLAFFEQVLPPFYLGLPPHALPVTTLDGAVYEPVAAYIVTVGYDLMILCGVIFLGGTELIIANISLEIVGR